MLQQTRTSRSRFILLLVLASALSLLTLDFRGFGPLETAQNGLRAVFEPVVGGVDSALNPVRNGFNGVLHYGDVKAENERLRERVAELEAMPLQEENAQQQLDELKKQMEITTARNMETRTARVLRGPVANFENNVRIDKGTSSGIRTDMVVVTAAGLVGRVVDVTDEQSVVELADSRNFGVGVRPTSATTPTNFALRGQGPGQPLLVQGDLGVDQVIEGGVVVTSGLDGSVFPPDIIVGRISKVPPPDGTSDGTARVSGVEVELEVDPSSLSFVTVLLWQSTQ
ncbi:MAG: rod shape-determining protein MreC [Acidimicrobiales bacterium]|nr:rod shape-determining protein MreC [Acidimicrobiales bacterium]